VAEKAILNFRVQGEPPTGGAAPLFSNFLAVSQVGTEVQFEFVFLDLNMLATKIEVVKAAGAQATPGNIEGKTVAKIIMPAAVFVQMKEHFDKILNALAQEGIYKVPEEKIDERTSTSVGSFENRR
jgi:hypothetical protein